MSSHLFLELLSALVVLLCTAFAGKEFEIITTTVTEVTYVSLEVEAGAATGVAASALPEIPTEYDQNEAKTLGSDLFYVSATSSHSFLTSPVNPESGGLTSSSQSSSATAESSTVHVTLTLVRATHSPVDTTSTVPLETETAYPSTSTSGPFPSSFIPEASSASSSSIDSTSDVSEISKLPTYPWQGTYTDKVLYSHNIHRLSHTVANLSWNQTLANAAYSWAQRCIFAHNTSSIPGGCGQNLAASSPTASISQHISDYWYNGEAKLYIPYYGQSNPPNLAAGHFTQVVWKGTGSVGCATIDCRRSSLGMWYTVCNYYPPGNFGGRYASNVLRPIGNRFVKGNASDIITQNSW